MITGVRVMKFGSFSRGLSLMLYGVGIFALKYVPGTMLGLAGILS
jgi:hypothetical protein